MAWYHVLQRRPGVAQKGASHRVNVVPAIAGVGWHLGQRWNVPIWPHSGQTASASETSCEQVRQTGVVVREYLPNCLIFIGFDMALSYDPECRRYFEHTSRGYIRENEVG